MKCEETLFTNEIISNILFIMLHKSFCWFHLFHSQKHFSQLSVFVKYLTLWFTLLFSVLNPMLRFGSRVSVLAKAVPTPAASVLHLASLFYTSIFSQASTDQQDLEVKLWTWRNKETKACLMLNKECFHIITYVLQGNERLLAVGEYTPLSPSFCPEGNKP